jgi:hypothetical protein
MQQVIRGKAEPSIPQAALHSQELIDAIVGEDVTRVRDLLHGGVDVNAPGRNIERERITKRPTTEYALTAASRVGACDVSKLLIAFGARIEAKDEIGDTPLLVAARCGNAEVAVYLLGRGADVHARNNDGSGVLLLAAWCGFFACREPNVKDVDARLAGLARQFLRAGADPNVRDRDGNTAFRINCSDVRIEQLGRIIREAGGIF